jgi:hypothetical protein
MDTFKSYVDKFEQSARAIFNSHIPKGNKSGNKLDDMISNLKDIPKQTEIINNKLVKEGNTLLDKASKDTTINTKKLKDEFFVITKKYFNEWTAKHKPK